MTLLLGTFFYCSASFGQSKENHRQFDEGYDQNGLGFGIVSQGSSGASLYYDRNFPAWHKQLHLQYDSTSEEASNLFGSTVAELRQTSLHGAIRHVTNSGWYIGGVVGWYNTTLDLHQISTDSKKPDQDLSFYNRGIIWGPEFGWQGNDFYYFTVGLRLLGRRPVAEHYKPDEIYDIANHRSTAAKMWENGKSYSAIYVGFGWYVNGGDDARQAATPATNNSDNAVIEKAKKCQEKGGVWVNDICRLEIQ